MAGSDVISRAPEPECCLAFVLHISTDKDKPVKDLKKNLKSQHTHVRKPKNNWTLQIF